MLTYLQSFRIEKAIKSVNMILERKRKKQNAMTHITIERAISRA